jgi:hypothetical protein
MTRREEIISLRQRLLDHGYQPVGVHSWDSPHVHEASVRPNLTGRGRSGCPSIATLPRTPAS